MQQAGNQHLEHRVQIVGRSGSFNDIEGGRFKTDAHHGPVPANSHGSKNEDLMAEAVFCVNIPASHQAKHGWDVSTRLPGPKPMTCLSTKSCRFQVKQKQSDDTWKHDE